MIQTINIKWINYLVVVLIVFVNLFINKLHLKAEVSEQLIDENLSYISVNGYLEEAINVDFTNGHALNISKYLIQNLWSNYSKEMNEAKQFIATDMLPHDAILWATRNGYRIIWQKPDRFHFIGIVDHSNILSILILNLGGYESLLKIQLLVRAATLRNPNFLTIKTKTHDKVNYEKIIRTLPDADLVIYGYANTIMSNIIQQTPSRELRYVPRFLIKYLKNTENWVGRLNRIRPLYVLRTKTNRTIWIVSNVYGEEAKWLFESIVARRPRKILITGMAGAIGNKFKVGSFITPAFWVNAGSVSALNWIRSLPDIPVLGIYKQVSTPLVETEKWIKEHSLFDLVDVEGGYIMKELKHSGLEAYLAYVISDQIGIKNADLTNWNNEQRRENLTKRLRFFLLSLGYDIRSLGLRSVKIHNIHRDGGY
ncbi:hypothetical protein I4U23_027243 [Adineta vaga]|nr:hypothetical protein I4U23_027243 [Adineta vaga]